MVYATQPAFISGTPIRWMTNTGFSVISKLFLGGFGQSETSAPCRDLYRGMRHAFRSRGPRRLHQVYRGCLGTTLAL